LGEGKSADGGPVRVERAGARIRRAREAHELRSEQLLDVGGANSAVVAAAEPEVAHRGEEARDLVGVGREIVVADLVIRIAIAELEREFMDEAVLDDRNSRFGKGLADVELTCDR
jgi:hypothetical protein